MSPIERRPSEETGSAHYAPSGEGTGWAEVCHLLLISDELWHEWRPAFGSTELRAAEERAGAVLARLLRDSALTGAQNAA